MLKIISNQWFNNFSIWFYIKIVKYNWNWDEEYIRRLRERDFDGYIFTLLNCDWIESIDPYFYGKLYGDAIK